MVAGRSARATHAIARQQQHDPGYNNGRHRVLAGGQPTMPRADDNTIDRQHDRQPGRDRHRVATYDPLNRAPCAGDNVHRVRRHRRQPPSGQARSTGRAGRVDATSPAPAPEHDDPSCPATPAGRDAASQSLHPGPNNDGAPSVRLGERQRHRRRRLHRRAPRVMAGGLGPTRWPSRSLSEIRIMQLRLPAEGLGAVQRAAPADQPEPGAVLAAGHDLRRRRPGELRPARSAGPGADPHGQRPHPRRARRRAGAHASIAEMPTHTHVAATRRAPTATSPIPPSDDLLAQRAGNVYAAADATWPRMSPATRHATSAAARRT